MNEAKRSESDFDRLVMPDHIKHGTTADFQAWLLAEQKKCDHKEIEVKRYKAQTFLSGSIPRTYATRICLRCRKRFNFCSMPKA